MLVNLYTKQHKNSLYELEDKGRITNKEIFVRLHMMDIADWFTEKYGRFVRMAEKKVPRPEGVEYPIWCSISQKNCMRPDENSVVYCLKVPKENVIYFSAEKWDYVLNNLYIPKDDEDEKAYLDQLRAMGINDRFSFIDGKLAGKYPLIENKIRDSWTRIFDIDKWTDFSVQANLWEIKEEWVQHIVYNGEDLFEVASDMTDDLKTHNPDL